MNKPVFLYSFKKRTIFYLFIGIFCILLDFISFITLSKIINPLYANPIGYSLGSICSFILNKRFTFKSKNSKLSFFRFSLVILTGFIASQIIIFVGISILGINDYLAVIKWFAMIVSVSIQFLGNNLYGSKSK
tara:strand:+ start:1201 stop:1599 length:399 start_codon:yes stop_codon:yes gene_type:complete